MGTNVSELYKEGSMLKHKYSYSAPGPKNKEFKEKAIEALTKAAEHGHPAAMYDLAWIYHQGNPSHELCLRYKIASAMGEYVPGMVMVAMHLQKRTDELKPNSEDLKKLKVSEEEAKAKMAWTPSQWLEKAINHTPTELEEKDGLCHSSQYIDEKERAYGLLALNLIHGKFGAERDLEKATEYNKKSKKDSQYAINNVLRVANQHEKIFKENKSKADGGDAKAMCALAALYNDKGDMNCKNYYFNAEKALEYAKKASETGEVAGLLKYGYFLMMGVGTTPDFKAAAESFAKAGEKDPEGNMALGCLLHPKFVVDKDNDKRPTSVAGVKAAFQKADAAGWAKKKREDKSVALWIIKREITLRNTLSELAFEEKIRLAVEMKENKEKLEKGFELIKITSTSAADMLLKEAEDAKTDAQRKTNIVLSNAVFRLNGSCRQRNDVQKAALATLLEYAKKGNCFAQFAYAVGTEYNVTPYSRFIPCDVEYWYKVAEKNGMASPSEYPLADVTSRIAKKAAKLVSLRAEFEGPRGNLRGEKSDEDKKKAAEMLEELKAYYDDAEAELPLSPLSGPPMEGNYTIEQTRSDYEGGALCSVKRKVLNACFVYQLTPFAEEAVVSAIELYKPYAFSKGLFANDIFKHAAVYITNDLPKPEDFKDSDDAKSMDELKEKGVAVMPAVFVKMGPSVHCHYGQRVSATKLQTPVKGKYMLVKFIDGGSQNIDVGYVSARGKIVQA